MKAVIVLPLLIAMVSALVLNDYQQQIILYIAINIILAVSLNLVNGFCGQFSLGHAGFMAVGAYASASLSLVFHPFSGGLAILNFLIYACVGGAAAAVAGFVVGLPSLRLRGDYLAIVTLGFGEIIRVILLNTQSLGGARGMYGIVGPSAITVFGLTITSPVVACWMGYFFAALTVVILWRWVHSTYGRAFLSIRDDELASECMGVPTTSVKILAFVISSFFAGVAGSLYAHATNFLSPATFSFMKSVDVVIMVVLGGMTSLTGSVVAAVIVTILPELLRPLHEWTGVDLRMVIYSLLLIVLMIMRPQGLFGSREWTYFWRKYVRRNA